MSTTRPAVRPVAIPTGPARPRGYGLSPVAMAYDLAYTERSLWTLDGRHADEWHAVHNTIRVMRDRGMVSEAFERAFADNPVLVEDYVMGLVADEEIPF